MSLSFFASLRPRLMLLAFLVMLPFIGLTLFTFAERHQNAIVDRLAVGIPPEVASAEANNLLLTNLLALVVICLIAIIVTWFGSDLLIRRYAQALLHAAQRIKAGDLGEPGELARAIDQMAALQQPEAERKQADNALRESQAFLEQAQQMAHIGNWVYTTEEKKAVWSKEIYAIFGLKEGEFDGTEEAFFAHVHPNDREAVKTSAYAALAGESSFDVDYRIIRPNGSLRWVHEQAYIVRGEDGQPLRMVGVMQDITERKEVEAALRHSEQRYRFITELISNFAFSYQVESDGSIHNEWFTDDSYKRITGYTPGEVGTTFKFFHPEDEERARRDVEGTIRGESSSAEYRIITKGGELRWLHIYRRPIWDTEQKRVVRYIGVAQDITERKLAEETLQRYTVELEQRVAERTDELQNALRQEKQVNELKSRFSSMVTHEFRNPLAAIHLSGDVLKKYHHKLTDDKRLEHIERIQARVKFLSDLLDDILTISKADTVGLDFNPAPLDLDALCRAVIEDMPPTREDAPQVVYASDGSTRITGDEKLLRQMFGNLLSNAVKYSLNGSPVQVDLRCREGDVVLCVADQGIGIPEADLKRLGDSFHRASNTSGIPGTGLGVAIAKRAAEAHGGSIAVESVVGVGSTFTVRLPLKN